MNNQKEHIKTIETFVLQLMDKYAKRKSNFEPLTKILGDFSKDPFLRAVRNVMFVKIVVHVDSKEKNMWQVARLHDCPMNENYVTWAAKKIIDEQIRIRKLAWFLNGWGNPYPPRRAIRFDISPEACMSESFATFKMRTENKMAEYVADVDLRDELLRAIYEYGKAMQAYGYSYGNCDGKEAHKDTLIKVYNDIEFGLNAIKGIIDED